MRGKESSKEKKLWGKGWGGFGASVTLRKPQAQRNLSQAMASLPHRELFKERKGGRVGARRREKKINKKNTTEMRWSLER